MERMLQHPGVPDAVKWQFWRAHPPLCPEQELFREVAGRAVLDALGITGLFDEPEHGDAVFDARWWFRWSDDDVRTVFDLAGVPHDGVGEAVVRRAPLPCGGSAYEEGR